MSSSSAGECNGGAGETGGTGGGSGGSSGKVVWSWGQQDNEPELEAQEWLVDSSEGSQQGSTAVHPPSFNARDEFSFSFDCGGAVHTQVRFFLDKPGAANLLELTVGGEDRPRVLPETTHDTNRRWLEQIVDVEPGAHTYTFRAWSESDSKPGIVIDSISCLNAEPREAVNGDVNLDDGFIPIEITGDWQADNALGVQEATWPFTHLLSTPATSIP